MEAYENRTFSLIDIFRITYKSAPIALILYVVVNAVQASMSLFLINATAFVLNTALELNNNFHSMLLPILLLVAVLILIELIASLMQLLGLKLRIKVNYHMSEIILRRKSLLRYEYIEDEKLLNMVSRVSDNASDFTIKGLNNIMFFVGLFIRGMGISIILLKNAWWSIFLIFGFTVPLCLLAYYSGKDNFNAFQNVSYKQRIYKYLDDVLKGREFIGERYLFGYEKELGNRWKSEYSASTELLINTEKKWFIKMKATGVIVMSAAMVIVIGLLPAVKNQTMSSGIFIALVNAIIELMNLTTWDLANAVDSLTEIREFMKKDMTNFWGLEVVKRTKNYVRIEKPIELQTIEFKDVSFSYPNSEKKVLDHLSFKIDKGNTCAFVGENGSGKSTIVKLLLGLYQNYLGSIYINGIELHKFYPEDLSKIISVVFQDFARYSITFKENIEIGSTEGKLDIQTINNILQKVGLLELVSSLKQGCDTSLGKIKKDGRDLSGGEWQRLALARSIASNAPCCILDEPTAALDPIGEIQMYEQFGNIMRDRTSIFITHRLGSVKLVDVIFVLKNGTITESGTHEQLILEKGIYYEMYESQKGWYCNQKQMV